MLKRAFPTTLIAAALGIAASGSLAPDFAQNVPARCLPQESRTELLQDGCGAIVTFGISGPRVLPGQAPDVETTGSVRRNGSDGPAEAGQERSE